MKIEKAHLFFEQSGTFKKAFQNLGISAVDYDIQNEFNETDYVVDLFEEINRAFDGKPSIFDTIKSNDLIMAFFPCIRFENQIMLFFRGQAYQQSVWTDEERMLYDMNLLDEVQEMYRLVNKLFIVCIRGGYRLIVENPFSEEHFLRRYWCLQPSIIDRDRRDNGDYSKKPTQYWFVNCTPEQNVLFEAIPDNSIKPETDEGNWGRWASMKTIDFQKMGTGDRATARSMIHPDYADRFIRQYITEGSKNE